MKTNVPQIHHHYHYVGTNKIAARWLIGFVVLMMSCGFFFSEPHHSVHHLKTKIPIVPEHDFLNSFFTWGNNCLASYARVLNLLVSFFGWKKSFLWFWYVHVGWGSLMYFGIPIVAVTVLIFVLKREKLILPLLLTLYIWHHGGELCYHKPWYFCFLVLFLLSPWMINELRKKIIYCFQKKIPKKTLQNELFSGRFLKSFNNPRI